MMELENYYYLLLKDKKQFMIGLIILSVKKVILHIVLMIVLQEIELIHIIL